MMETPICDFVRKYAESGALRLHMPGHKGTPLLGMEPLDITEIDGADSLYEADGIIRASEVNAGRLFGSTAFYSTEGSSLAIRAMLYLAVTHAGRSGQTSGGQTPGGQTPGGQRPLIAAGRNAHRTFISAAALLDFDILWLRGRETSYLSCEISAAELDDALNNAPVLPAAVYLTSPDYLGNVADIAALSEVCRRHGVLLLVDNAHGAYLKFLPQSRHPIDLGADICCDSAHKTLPVLTGGAYLHISPNAPRELSARAKDALALFGSTSPSYLILESLDAANRYLEDHASRLARFIPSVAALKDHLRDRGWTTAGDEELKLTLCPKFCGYTGADLAKKLSDAGIVCEFADPDFTVLMLTPEVGTDGLRRLRDTLDSVERRAAITDAPPAPPDAERVMSVRDAVFSPSEVVPASESEGRILAAANVSCPPAVPIAVCGERIDSTSVRCFEYYGITRCAVVKE